MTEGRSKFINLLFSQGLYIMYSFILIVGKLASKEQVLSLKFILFFMLELFIFGIYAVLWQQLIKRMDLNKAYSAKGTVILWTLLWSWLFFEESIKLNNVIGALVILLGIYMVMKDE